MIIQVLTTKFSNWLYITPVIYIVLYNFAASRFGIVWLNETEQVQSESVGAQFNYIKSKTGVEAVDPVTHDTYPKQDAQHYGDLSIAQKDNIGLYEGPNKYHQTFTPTEPQEMVSIRDAPVVLAQKKIEHANNNEDRLR